MKKILLLFFCLIMYSFNAIGQVPYATTSSDQVIQGPCYIFATVAALESKILESSPSLNTTLDLYEWNLYSKSILGTRSGDGHKMVTKVLPHANSKGIYTAASNYIPTSTSNIPNPNELLVPGIADFTVCSNNFSNGDITYFHNPAEGTCEDDEDEKFEIVSIEGNKYEYSYTGTGYVRDNTPTVQEMKDHLDAGRGLIAFFTDWDGGTTAHAVFIHGYSGSNWKYKNSWPGSANSNASSTLDISKCTDYYYLTGTMTLDNGASCAATLSGGTSVVQNTTYTLQNNGTSVSGVSWSVSNNLTIVSQSSSNITVRANNCTSESGYVTASYTSSGVSCQVSKSITVAGSAVSTPTSISVLSLDWNNGDTCPGTTLELHANDNNPGYPYTTYNWSISGATIISGQGTPTLYVQTPSGSGTTYLTFKVRAKNGNCSYSGWRTLYGQSDPSNCGGGGFFLSFNNQSLTVENLNNLDIKNQQMRYQVITLDGKIMNEGFIERDKTQIDISEVTQKLVILRIYDPITGFYQSEKYFIK